jgi:aspartate/methionine/tyrosine aminotransferase
MIIRPDPYPALAMDEINHIFNSSNYKNLDHIDFGKGSSCFNPLDHVDFPDNICFSEYLTYGDITGLTSLRSAICQYYREKFDYDLSPKRICITDGASGALTIALAMLLREGGEIILPESCYPAYKLLTKILKANNRFTPVRDDFCLDIVKLPQFITKNTCAIIVNSPSNPHGTFLQTHELEAITSLGIPVVFDEVYQSLPITDSTIPSAINFSNQHFIVNSLSKSIAIAGIRIGYLIVPEEHVPLMTNLKAILNMCTSLPGQILAEHLMQYWDTLIDQHKKMLKENWLLFQETANSLGLTLRSKPQAGFFALIDIARTGRSSVEISRDLAAHHALATVPGLDFQEKNHDFLRLNFACSSNLIKPGLYRLANYLHTLSNTF